jgi:uncharacterized protein YbjT (DUF2867 family)
MVVITTTPHSRLCFMKPQDIPHVASEPLAETVLVTGATGFIGGRLLARLERDRRHRVRCLTRRPEALAGRTGENTKIVAGDLLVPDTLARAMTGVDSAYYLVHSMSGGGEFSELDRAGARHFAAAARTAGVKRFIYLGGLGAGRGLSAHLASRQEVGRILHSSGVPTVEFRASIVIGSGSASYEIVRALVEHLPVALAPHWIETAAQPIAVEDVVEYLIAALGHPEGAIFEIGGEGRGSYAEIIREYARQRGLRRRLLRSPLLTPRVSRFGLGLLAPAHRHVAGAMVDSLRNETVVRTGAAREAFGVTPLRLDQAVERALAEEDRDFARTRWSNALPAARPDSWRGVRFGRRLVSSRVIHVPHPPRHAFASISRLGGPTGWYGTERFWRFRGALGVVRGGVGTRRGRRHPVDLRVGDTVDSWRVEGHELDRVLRLVTEMKLPGRLWLQFEVDPDGPDRARIRQTTVFDPAGYVGLGYWYLLSPVHHLVFGRVLGGIDRAIRERASGAAHEYSAADARGL